MNGPHRSRSGLSRRTFLRRSASSVAFAAGGATLAQLGASAHAASTDGYRALVCILLAGGADSFNMLVPTDAASYAGYAGVRTDLALPSASLSPLSGTHQGGRPFAMHPGLSPLAPLFDSGEMAWVANVGSLVEPTSAEQLAAGTVREPLGLYSHADQIEQWQTSVADARISSGVGGRIADLLGDVGGSSPISMNLSTSGANVFQSGARTQEYSVEASSGGAPMLAGREPGDDGAAILTPAVDELLAASRTILLRRAYAKRFADSLRAGEVFRSALASAPMLTTGFGVDPFSRSMELIARIIAARGALGATRQTFFVTYGGWDHHDEVINAQAAMLPPLAAGLAAFRDAMIELGTHSDVTTFTISDFGRTLTSNGRGSDHGWGGNQLVLGGSVRGGRILGTFPVLAAGAPLDTGRGRFVPTTSVDAFYADLALWFGLTPSELPLVLPNLQRFHDPGAGPAVGLFG